MTNAEIASLVFSGLMLANVAWTAARLLKAVRRTTLWPAYFLTVIVAVATVCVLGDLMAAEARRIGGIQKQLVYGVAIAWLCPPIMVLGAKRPMSRAWPWFVVLPLVSVFTWPLLWVWVSRIDPAAWTLESPLVLGFVLVLMMGLGNHIGTRYWTAAVFLGLFQLSLVLPTGHATAAWFPTRWRGECGTAHPLMLSILFLMFTSFARSRGFPEHSSRSIERVWADFWNTFGIVWGKRILDSMNATAESNRWPVRFTPPGHVAAGHCIARLAGEPVLAASLDRKTRRSIEATLRWNLRRFVDSDWFAARLPDAESTARSQQSTETSEQGSRETFA